MVAALLSSSLGSFSTFPSAAITRLRGMWPPAPRHNHFLAESLFLEALLSVLKASCHGFSSYSMHTSLCLFNTRSPTLLNIPPFRGTSPCSGWHTTPSPPFPLFLWLFSYSPPPQGKKVTKSECTLLPRLQKSALHLGIMCTTHTSGPNHRWREEGTRNVMKKCWKLPMLPKFLHNFVIF